MTDAVLELSSPSEPKEKESSTIFPRILKDNLPAEFHDEVDKANTVIGGISLIDYYISKYRGKSINIDSLKNDIAENSGLVADFQFIRHLMDNLRIIQWFDQSKNDAQSDSNISDDSEKKMAQVNYERALEEVRKNTKLMADGVQVEYTDIVIKSQKSEELNMIFQRANGNLGRVIHDVGNEITGIYPVIQIIARKMGKGLEIPPQSINGINSKLETVGPILKNQMADVQKAFLNEENVPSDSKMPVGNVVKCIFDNFVMPLKAIDIECHVARSDTVEAINVRMGLIDLQILLSNLSQNTKRAIDARHDLSGGITEEMKQAAVTLKLNDSGDGVIILFEDNGKGLPQDIIDAQSFRKRVTDWGEESSIKGTGIGMAECEESLKGRYNLQFILGNKPPEEGTGARIGVLLEAHP